MKVKEIKQPKKFAKNVLSISQKIANDLQKEKDEKVNKMLKSVIGKNVESVHLTDSTVILSFSNNVLIVVDHILFCIEKEVKSA